MTTMTVIINIIITKNNYIFLSLNTHHPIINKQKSRQTE